MSSAMSTPMDLLYGAGRVNGATVAPADGSDVANGGFRVGNIRSVQRTGAGAYTIALGNSGGTGGLDTLTSMCNATLDAAGAAAEDICIQHTTDNIALVTTFAAGAPADRSFKFEIRQVKPTTT